MSDEPTDIKKSGRPRATEMEMDAALSEAVIYLRAKGFDNVAIFGSYSCNDEDESTGSATGFGGNYFANVGQILSWVEDRREKPKVLDEQDEEPK